MNKKTFFITLGTLLCLPIILWASLRIYNAVIYDRNAGGHIERAAHANSVETTKVELKEALRWLEANGMTHGYTSVAWNTPDEDVGFWYNNIRAGLAELEALSPDSSSLEQSNVLMRLREALSKEPSGISVFPYNVGYSWFGWLSGLALIGGIILFLLGLDA